MRKEKVTKRLKQNKGITLIALIITIVVLLILAVVTISQITGSENAMEKATEAREKNEQGAEFDAIKLAAVSSVAEGNLDLYVDIPTLRNSLTGLIQEDPAEVITTNTQSWIVTGNSGTQYRITNNGLVSALLTIDNAIINAITVDVGSTIPLNITNANEIEEIKSCSIAKVTPTGGTETTVASIEKNNTTKIWEITGIALPTLPEDAESVETILTITGKSGKTKEVALTVNKPVTIAINDEIDFKVDLIGTTTDADWVILYDGTNDDSTEKPLVAGKIFAILKDYLPNEKRIDLGIGTDLRTDDSKPYNVWILPANASSFVDILNGTSENWNSLITSNITSKETINGNKVQVVGALDASTMQSIKGNDSVYYKPSNASKKSIHKCSGYWLATKIPYSENMNYITDIGHIANINSNLSNFGLCPVVILPSDIPLKRVNGIWEVDTTQMVDNN